MSIKSYQDAVDYLGKKQERPLANNTRIKFITRQGVDPTSNHPRIEQGVAIRLHQTNVVIYWEKGEIVLNSGGWKTPTTKERINSFSPVRISQHKGVWSFGYGSQSHLFADGVTLHGDGTVTGAATANDDAERKSLDNQIKKFAKVCASAVPLDMPGPGCCLGCQIEAQGQDFGLDHLKLHMEENYAVPSLVWKALEFCGYQPQKQIIHSLVFNGPASSMTGVGRDAVKRSVKKYLRQRFGLVR